MDFDFTTETITPDSTTILTIGGKGALELPSGLTSDQPGGVIAGAIRWNTTVPQVEYYSGSAWLNFGGSVTSVTGSGGTTGLTLNGGPITTAGTLTLGGTLVVGNGGTGATTLTQNGVLYGNGTSAIGATAAGTTGQVLIATTGAAPSWGTLSGVSVTSFQTSLSGLTPSTATTGAITLAGTLGLSSGGTGANLTDVPGGIVYGGATTMAFSAAGTSNQILQSNGTSAPSWTSAPTVSGANITSGTIPNSSLVNSSITVTGGTGLGVSGSPVSLGGTVTLSNTGVTSIAGTAGNITTSASTGAVTLNLASVTQGSGSNFVKVTLDGFGRVTGNTAVAQSDLTGLLGTYYLPTAGGTMSGAINMGNQQINNLAMSGTPAGTDAVNVNYVQSQLTGLSWKQAVKASSTTALTTTYNNGASGVGATLTNAGTQAAFTVDGVTFTGSGTERVLIKNQANSFENGIYVLTTLGSGSTNWVLTRSTDADTAAEVDGAAVYVQQGSTLADTGWTETATMTAIGSGNPIVWAQFSGSGAYTAGTGLTLTGNTFSLTNPVALSLGGTNSANTGSNGSIMYNNGSAIVNSSVGTSGYYLTSGGAGAPTWSNPATSLVTSFSAGTTGLTPNSATTGAITLAGTLAIANGGTGLTSTPSNGQIDIGNGSGFTRTTISAGTGITVTNGAGSIQISNAGVTTFQTSLSGLTPSTATSGAVTLAGTLGATSGGTGSSSAPTSGQILYSSAGTTYAPTTLSTIAVTTFSGGTTGLTPNTATSGAVTLAGTLGVANGGTALTSTPANGQLLIGNGTNYTLSTLTAGSNIYITNAAGSITVAGPKFYSEFTTAPVNAPSATASQAIALGTGSSASIYGVLANANGQFATAGDAEQIQAVLRVLTTSAATSEMFLDGAGASQRLVLPNNSAWTFTINLVARRTDATGSYGSWIFNGLIYRDANAASTTISGLSKTTIARLGVITGVVNDPVISADTTNGSLKIAVYGYGAYNIRWVASIQLAQVTN